MFYINLRNLIMNAIPGAGLANFIYIGMIAFFIVGLLTYRKWMPFIVTAIFAAAIGFFDNSLVGISTTACVHNAAHMLVLPFIITLLYFRRG
ncbi:MAG: PAM68 family protein [Rickettsiales bacterium]|jgi:NO-binding membrane sensor protein with MHYT domain|nr:PAM68 family protein [Rickettsiales bacterium]